MEPIFDYSIQRPVMNKVNLFSNGIINHQKNDHILIDEPQQKARIKAEVEGIKAIAFSGQIVDYSDFERLALYTTVPSIGLPMVVLKTEDKFKWEAALNRSFASEQTKRIDKLSQDKNNNYTPEEIKRRDRFNFLNQFVSPESFDNITLKQTPAQRKAQEERYEEVSRTVQSKPQVKQDGKSTFNIIIPTLILGMVAGLAIRKCMFRAIV